MAELEHHLRAGRGQVSVLSVAAGSVIVTASASMASSALEAAAQDAQAIVGKPLGGRCMVVVSAWLHP